MILLAHFTGIPHDAPDFTIWQCAFLCWSFAQTVAIAAWQYYVRGQRSAKKGGCNRAL
jgi:hypothetical protein